MKIIIATHNMKKRAELERILSPLGIEIVTDNDIGCTLRDVEENGTTFEENAFIKAQAGCEDSGLPCIADDSGLVVDALGGAPGIFSARYCGVHGNDEANNDKLLKELENVPDEERTARFVCAVCCVFPD
ncbi:MAG: non-canonical purine NTP pyrophosphatase, partial [Acutalibacteraceae bacterium]|nr:non-canonical purine NTP pyrophosphatase [Acutalibacteraceae bacterium]